VARITVFTESGFRLSPVVDSNTTAPLSRKALAVVEESANLHRDEATVVSLPGGRTAVLTFNVSSQGVDGVVLAQAPLRDVQEQVTAVERRLVIGGARALGGPLLARARGAPSLRA